MADSGIETLEDLKGKTVSVGSPNSGTEVIALRLLEVAGLDPDDDIGKRGLGVGESVQALRDGSIDAFFWSGGVPTGAITDLTTTDDVRLLALDATWSRSGSATARHTRKPRSRRASTGRRGHQDDRRAEPADGRGGHAGRVRLPGDEAAVRRQGAARDVHKAAESLDPKTAREVVEPVQLHPGAQRYYEEAGG